MDERLSTKDKLDIDFFVLNNTTHPCKVTKSTTTKADTMPNITKEDFISWFSEGLDEEIVIEK